MKTKTHPMEEWIVVAESVMLFSYHAPYSQIGGIQPGYSHLIQHCCMINDEVKLEKRNRFFFFIVERD